QVVTLAEGDTVDFQAGRGADGTLYGSGLTLQAMLTPLAADGAVTVFPSGGYFTNDVQITMVCSVTNAAIHYSLDASKPTAHSPIWTGGLVLTNSAVIQAQAFLGDLPISESVVTTFLRVYAFDNDGIAADWRLRFFGPGYPTNPLAAASADPDGDGANNLKEYQAGSNPLDSSSVPLLLAVRLAPIISWDSISNVVYRVQRRILSETNWVDLAPDVVATGSMSSYVDRDAVKSALYRVIIP
ncbi:MAG TPA: chitobiase/beta-hexosaminidase C-terminal domain-containing protein, partial [Candidatus Limnocylindria bacterium]|nr:chitobiase/beta-hexosaminidase C-terminal domain-containing protein [Candidatus Limnocylindria bacterium]